MNNPFDVLALALVMVPVAGFPAAADAPNPPRWSWQETYAEVDPKGGLAWQPRSFVFETAAPVRYIDFEGGDDTNPGDGPGKPWKHHPWDPKATGNSAASGTGIRTYVFKRGSVYRGHLVVKGSGQPDAPIRLTSDPSWGQGEAVLCGSERVLARTKGATHKDNPEPERVWWADLDFAPREIEVRFLEGSANPFGPFNSKAIGEPPFMYGIAAYFALVDAIRAARPEADVGAKAPLTAETVLMALAQRDRRTIPA